jgi:hypothetical protein
MLRTRQQKDFFLSETFSKRGGKQHLTSLPVVRAREMSAYLFDNSKSGISQHHTIARKIGKRCREREACSFARIIEIKFSGISQNEPCRSNDLNTRHALCAGNSPNTLPHHTKTRPLPPHYPPILPTQVDRLTTKALSQTQPLEFSI